MLRYTIVALFLCFLTAPKLHAQNILKGDIRDEKGTAIGNVNIVLFDGQGETILAYTYSDPKGGFSLSYSSKKDSLMLEIRCIGFETKKIRLVNPHPYFLYAILKTAEHGLNEVIIEDMRAIVKRNDTLNYSVKAFEDKSDRTIIDVIRKLPGIKVSESGQISYQNKPINKFYVDGKDLLEDRYSIASNNLPIDAVDLVQVLQHHQPIKLLDGIEQSDRAAINIKLNDRAKNRLIGNIKAGLGIAPLMRDNNATLLKFSRDIQFINSLKNNNVGIDLSSEIAEQNTSQNLTESGSTKQDLVAVVRAGRPPIDRFRYWFNDNTMATGNYLKGLNKSLDVKMNVAFLNDYLTENNSTTTRIFLPDDTIALTEIQQGKNPISTLSTGITLQANTDKAYLKNAVKFNRTWSSLNNSISSTGVEQQLRNPFINFINDLGGILNVNGTLLGLSSFTSFTNLPQHLTISPGQFPGVLNGGTAYDEVVQHVQLANFYTNNTVSVNKRLGVFSFNNKIGLLVQLQELDNSIDIVQNGTVYPAGGNFANSISRKKLRLYDENKLTYIRKKLIASLGLNIAMNSMDNAGTGIDQHADRFFINPLASLRYNISSSFETDLSIGTSNNLSFDANPSFILKNYRSLANSNVPLREVASRSLFYTLTYKNIINGIFSSIDIGYSRSNSNILLDTRYEDYFTTVTFIAQDNPSTDLNVSFSFNKYYADLNTGIDISIGYDEDRFRQQQQDKLTDFRNRQVRLGTKINSKVSNSISLEHTFNISIYKNAAFQDLIQRNFPPLRSIRQNLLFKLFYPNGIQTKFNVEHYYNNSTRRNRANSFFADVTLQKSIAKPKIDFAVAMSNIFNFKEYVNLDYNNNVFVNSVYQLRNRTLMFSTSFQF